MKRSRRSRRPLRVDPIALGRLIQRRRVVGLLVAFAVIVAVALLDRWANLLPVDDDWHRYHGQTFEVLRVIDGDTLDLRVPDGDRATTRVRLWGVNTPEMNASDPDTPPQRWAQEATDFTRQAAEGQRVTLWLQSHRLRGRYGRLLAYVQLPDGRELNAALIEQGLSKHDDRWGHDQATAYDLLQLQARQRAIGLWSPKEDTR